MKRILILLTCFVFLIALRGSESGEEKLYWEILASSPKNATFGADLTSVVIENYIYAIRGNPSGLIDPTRDFWRYNIFSNTWEVMAPHTIVGGQRGAGTLHYPGSGNYIYYLIPNDNWGNPHFLRYSISEDMWEALPKPPVPNWYGGSGVSLTSSDNYIYAMMGNGRTDFLRYSISENEWMSIAADPGGDAGASLIYPGTWDYIYRTIGGWSQGFWRYSISQNYWTSLASTPDVVYLGGDMAYPGTGDFIYATGGNTSSAFWRYSISNNSWETLPSAPAGFYAGGALASGGGNFIYAFRGGEFPDGSSDFYRFVISPPVVSATVDIDPNTLNLKSKGKFIAAYIELAEGYYVEDIDINSVTLTKINDYLLDPPLYTVGPSAIGDYDDDGIHDLMVKFGRQKLIPLLEVGNAELTVTGGMVDGLIFEGTVTIRVIDLIKVAGFWYYAPLTDIEGNPKPNPSGSLPDIGAYEFGLTVGVEENLSLIVPDKYSLEQNFPNPFNPSTKIKYSVPVFSKIQIKVFDILGNIIETLIDEEKPAGTYELTWYAENLPSGIYFYKIQAGSPSAGSGQGFVETKKMVLLK